MVFPALAGEIALFDRSWNSRAGVEKVMGFASDAQVDAFLAQAPVFEKLLSMAASCCSSSGCADQQGERFAARLADPLKRWKFSPIDLEARKHYAACTQAPEAMLKTVVLQPIEPYRGA